jgi:bacteriorhodopsin
MWFYFISGWILLVILLQIKKRKQPGGKLSQKIAFFHPFWYFYDYLAMMQEVERKFFGP